MSKSLFLCRHADALYPTSGQSDFTRNLSPAGILEAKKAAQWLTTFSLPIEAIMCSAATRTYETAKILALQISIPEKNIAVETSLYNASTAALLKYIGHLPNSLNHVILVGHNPGISEIITRIIGKEEYMPTGGINLITFEISDWQEIEIAPFQRQRNY